MIELPTTSGVYLAASRGRLKGVIPVHKFGLAEDIDTADGQAFIWDGCSDLLASKIPIYTFSDSANITDVASTSALDTQEIEVQGLDANWEMSHEHVFLNGQNVVQLATPLRRVFRMYNAGATNLAGFVYVSTTGAARTGGLPTVNTTVRAIVHPLDAQTQMAIYTVPAGYDLYITEGWSNIANRTAASVIVRVFQREPGGVFRILHTLSVSSTGSSGDHRPYRVPLRIPEKTDLVYRAETSTNSVAVSAGFHGILVKR